MKDRGIRRSQKMNKKAKAKKIMKEIWEWDGELMDEKHIGKVASTHGKACSSCPGCGNPRRHFHKKTIQERKAEINTDED